VGKQAAMRTVGGDDQLVVSVEAARRMECESNALALVVFGHGVADWAVSAAGARREAVVEAECGPGR
jgi:hypothetical protein